MRRTFLVTGLLAFAVVAITALFSAATKIRLATPDVVPTAAFATKEANAATIPVKWSVSIDENTGLPNVSAGGRKALSASYVFWGNSWAWAGLSTNLSIASPFDYTVSGTNKLLDFDLNSHITKPSRQQLVWDIDLNARNAKSDVIGGGLEFTFDLATFGTSMGDPQLLPGNHGWVWGKEGGNRIEMRFSPAAAASFGLGRNNEIRVFFYSGQVPAGKQHFTVTLDVSDKIAINQTVTERFDNQDMKAWPKDMLVWNTAPVDLSFLNENEKPAGKRGFVKAKGEMLVFQDGTPVRFWGTNVNASTIFDTSKDAVRQQAKRMSALGFNLVRLHHHDSPWVYSNIFGKNATDTQTLDPASLEKIDWWIKCLKDEGIYIWLDLHVLRALKEKDNIYAFDEIAKGKDSADLRGYNYINLTIQQAMKRFNEAYLNHRNPYTGSDYKDEPAIMAILITNEGDLTFHFGNSLLPDKKVPKHNQIYMNEAKVFAQKHDLPSDKTWRSWEHGPSKIFLNDLEQRFNADMISHLREMGVKAPIATTNAWGENLLSSLPALTVGDIIDVHSYGDVGQLEKDPRVSSNLIHGMASAHIAGKPLSVTEWNVSPFPVPDRHTVPIYVAASASHQGWDALMQFAYAQAPLDGSGSPSNWHAFNDPSLIAMLPAAALLYRQGHVKEATTTYALAPSREQLFYQPIKPDNSAAIRTAAEKGKLVINLPNVKELPWLAPAPVGRADKVIRDPNQSLIPDNASEVVSDTGELRRNWEKGIFTIDTPLTQAAMGWVGSEEIALKDIKIKSRTRNASLAVQSLDRKPISQSGNIMISLGSQSVPEAGNKLPFHFEPVEGQLAIRAPKGLKLYKKGIFQEMGEVPVNYKAGEYMIDLDKSLNAYWLFLR
jgi:hypothetical protein